jgi:serine/threonine-protein kinase
VRPGDVLAGKYRVERVLGEGGMGVVVAARHLQLDQIVALKFLLPEMVANPEALGRFMREARNAVRLRSEHVARIIDVGTLDTGAPYIVMEFLEGSDVAGVLAHQRVLPIPVAVDFILQACDAIAEAHALGIIHRDLKPQNLFVTRRHDGTSLVKVLDFGISKSMASSDFAATRTQAVMGSPAYMSPEQMRSAKFVDARTDVWALGIILYQLVVGHVPWDAETFTELCFKVSGDPLPPFPSIQQAGFEEVVRRCLEKDPNRRFPDVYALAVALLSFAPPHARPLVEQIGRVLGGHAGGHAAMPAIVATGPGTLREAAGQRVTRTAMGSRGRRIAGLVATIGLLAGIVVTVVALSRGSGGGPADQPALSPVPNHAVAQPVADQPTSSPVPAPVAAQPAAAHPPVVAQPPQPPPPPSVREHEPPTAHEPTSAATPQPQVGPPPAPSTAAKPHDRGHDRRPPITTPTKPSNTPPAAAPPAAKPPTAKPAASDPLSTPE